MAGGVCSGRRFGVCVCVCMCRAVVGGGVGEAKIDGELWLKIVATENVYVGWRLLAGDGIVCEGSRLLVAC